MEVVSAKACVDMGQGRDLFVAVAPVRGTIGVRGNVVVVVVVTNFKNAGSVEGEELVDVCVVQL
jgi:hypothetical protein